MELEFDKEIDALLRRAADTAPPASGHLDADELAAFAENALPAAARSNYVMHLADCSRCRMSLSGLVSMGTQTVPDGVAERPEIVIAVPWYQKLFKMPDLAYGFGALVVIFGGMLGFLVFQDRFGERGTELSQAVAEREVPPSRPALSPEPQALASNAANAASNTNASSSMPNISRSGVAVGSSTEIADEDKPAVQVDPAPAGRPVDAVTSAAPPPPPPKDALAAERDDRLEKAKEQPAAPVATEEKKLENLELQARRDGPTAAKKTGPSREAGPRSQNVQDNTMLQRQNLPSASTRDVGGKRFELRDGVWYDSAYSGQATSNYRRGTADYLRLDAGLRSIADSISGTVVVVWKDRAYRIR